MQSLGLEYLRFADGIRESAKEAREEDFRQDLLMHIAKAGLAATGEYKEEVLFEEYFPESTPSDDEVDYADNSGVTYQTPDEEEMALLAQMMANDTITVDGAPLEGPDAEQVSRPAGEDDLPALPPPRSFDLGEVDQDTEWV